MGGVKRKAEDAPLPAVAAILAGDAQAHVKLVDAAKEVDSSTAAQFFTAIAPFVRSLPPSSVERDLFDECVDKKDEEVLLEASFLCRAGLKEDAWLQALQIDAAPVRKVKLFSALLTDAKEDEEATFGVNAGGDEAEDDDGEEGDDDDEIDEAAAFLASITEADCIERTLPEDDPKWLMSRPTAELVEMCEMNGHTADELADLSRLELVQRVFVSMFANEAYSGDEGEEGEEGEEGDEADEDEDEGEEEIDDDIHD